MLIIMVLLYSMNVCEKYCSLICNVHDFGIGASIFRCSTAGQCKRNHIVTLLVNMMGKNSILVLSGP